MKSLLITTFVFGESYCSYIAPYIYCAKKAYPEYDILINVDTEENISSITHQLKKLDKAGITGYKIQKIKMPEGLSQKALSDKSVNMAARWLCWNEEYREYEGVYIGDIDLLICKEGCSLFDQHEIHCQTLGLPFSNIARVYNRKLTLRQIASMTKKWGIITALKDTRKQLVDIPRLTGLHYFKPSVCGDRIKEALPREYDEINSIFNGTNLKYGVYSALDEFFLFGLYEKAGYQMPNTVQVSAFELMEQNDPRKVVFRPHHGIHLGIWRGGDRKEMLSAESNKLAFSKTYMKYKEQIFFLYNFDAVFRDIVGDDTSFAGKIIGNMMRYYQEEA